jgi:hypothetical protein
MGFEPIRYISTTLNFCGEGNKEGENETPKPLTTFLKFRGGTSRLLPNLSVSHLPTTYCLILLGNGRDSNPQMFNR